MSLLGHAEFRNGARGTDAEISELEALAAEARTAPRLGCSDAALWALCQAAALSWTPAQMERVIPAFVDVRGAVLNSEPTRLSVLALDAIDRRLIHGYPVDVFAGPVNVN